MDRDRIPWLIGHVAVDLSHSRLIEEHGVDAVVCVSVLIIVLAATRQHRRRHARLHTVYRNHNSETTCISNHLI